MLKLSCWPIVADHDYMLFELSLQKRAFVARVGHDPTTSGL